MPLMYRLGQLEADALRLDFFFFVMTYDCEQNSRWHSDPQVTSLHPSPLSKPCRQCCSPAQSVPGVQARSRHPYARLDEK